MRARALVLCAGLTACSSAPRIAAAPPHLSLVPCGPAVGDEDTTVLGRRVALVGDTVVIAGEARGSFVLDGAERRCPSSPSVLVLGRTRAGAARFAWCVASPSPFASVVPTRDGFALAGRTLRDAAVEPPVPATSADAPSRGPEEVSVLRFGPDGALRQRAVLAPGPGSIASVAALPDGSLIAEGTGIHLPPAPVLAEHFLARLDPQGATSDLEPRREVPLGGSTVELVARPAGGVFRVAVERETLMVEILDGAGGRDVRARVPAPGTVMDLAAAAGTGDDDLWIAWSQKTGRGDAVQRHRQVAKVGKTGIVNERSLGHEAINAHVYGLVALGPDRAAVMFQLWKERGEPARFGALQLDVKAELGALLLVAYDIPGKDEVALSALGDGVVALGIAGEPGSVVLTGWFRGALRVPSGPPLAQHRCGLFVGTVALDDARFR